MDNQAILILKDLANPSTMISLPAFIWGAIMTVACLAAGYGVGFYVGFTKGKLK